MPAERQQWVTLQEPRPGSTDKRRKLMDEKIGRARTTALLSTGCFVPNLELTTLNEIAREDRGQFGPAMSALTERQRAFVCHYFEFPRKHGAGTYAAVAAGYGNNRASSAAIAYQLLGDEKIQRAIEEESRKRIVTLGPLAVRALKKLLETPSSRDHGRALGIVMDRIAPQSSTLEVNVKGEVKMTAAQTADVLARIEQLCSKFAVALPAPKTIEHVAA